MGFIKEFKEFAMRGNVMDMAVGVIIGGAFGKIVHAHRQCRLHQARSQDRRGR